MGYILAKVLCGRRHTLPERRILAGQNKILDIHGQDLNLKEPNI